MGYSPFGEIVNSAGLAAWYGFTGEQQDSTSGLTYLRSRYYNPALGRFLTPDSLIPDVTDGQALNAYAYVYNDPINLVDPSGHFGVDDTINWVNKHAPAKWKSGIRDFAAGGLNWLDKWYNTSDGCDCNDAGTPGSWGPVAGVGAQAAWAKASTPAGCWGTFIIEARFDQTITSWWRKLPGMQSRFANKIIPNSWGYKTTLGPWEPWETRTGWIDEITPSGSQSNGTHYISDTVRSKTAGKVNWKSGIRGTAGAALIAGVIDGATQWISDWNLCLSQAEKLFRVSVATALGIVAGLAASLAFAAGVAFVAAPLFGISATGAVLIPVLAGFGAGLWTGIGMNHLNSTLSILGGVTHRIHQTIENRGRN